MFRTISLGTCVSVQGKVIKMLKDGRMTVQVGQKLFTGRSVVPLAGSARPKLPRLLQA